MKFQFVNMHTMKTEVEFETSTDRSMVEFTERMCELRKSGIVDNLIERTEQSIVLESMRNSGMFESRPHCFVVIS